MIYTLLFAAVLSVGVAPSQVLACGGSSGGAGGGGESGDSDSSGDNDGGSSTNDDEPPGFRPGKDIPWLKGTSGDVSSGKQTRSLVDTVN